MCFDYGFGPFRWVCGSGKPEDLAKSDAICAVLEDMALKSTRRNTAANAR
jgi:urocanate hydratase